MEKFTDEKGTGVKTPIPLSEISLLLSFDLRDVGV